MYSHFIEGLRSGTFRKLSLTEVKEIVMRNHFGFTPLTHLAAKEEELLLELTLDDIYRTLNHGDLEGLCGQVFYDGETFFINSSGTTIRYPINEPRLLSPDQKIELLLDPKIWHRGRISIGIGSGCLTKYGNRNLLHPDGYFHNEGEFKELLEKIRQKAGVNKLMILDIGCGMGKALQDMKELDSNIETHGLTIEPEPAMFNADYFHYMVAERMPLEFEGKFHLIVSNMAFRYFLFPHTALLNVVKALASGGYANLHFSYESSPHSTKTSRQYFSEKVPEAKSNYEAMKVLVRKTMAELEVFQKAGKIKMTPSSNFYDQAMQGGLVIEKISD